MAGKTTLFSPPGGECPFGVRCYRRNPHHFREYSHPHLEERLLKTKDSSGKGSFSSHLSPEAQAEQLKIYREIRAKRIHQKEGKGKMKWTPKKTAKRKRK